MRKSVVEKFCISQQVFQAGKRRFFVASCRIKQRPSQHLLEHSMQLFQSYIRFVAPVVAFPFVAGDILYEVTIEPPNLEALCQQSVQRSPCWEEIHLLAYQGQTTQVIERIETGVNPEVRDSENWTPLHWTTADDQSDTAAVLLERKVNPNPRNIDAQTPLHEAANWDSPDVATVLIHNGADASLEDNNGMNPLHSAAFHDHPEVVFVILLEAEPDLDATDNDGNTALHGSAQNGNPEITSGLVEAGANVQARDNDGWTALHEAARESHLHMIMRQVSPEIANNPILAMSNHNMPPILGSLVNYPKDREFFIQAAAKSRESRLDVAKILITAGSDPNATDLEGWTPLHGAAESGDREVAKVLIQAGSNPKAKNNEGKTPLDIARERGHNDIVQMLRRQLRISIPMPRGF